MFQRWSLTCRRMTTTNVVVFGSTGSGKSSLINMIAGSNAATSSGSRGCTFESHPYHAIIRGRSFTFYDTCGFNEGAQSRTPNQQAIVELYRLLKSLQDGVSLLVFVMKMPARIEASTTTNWRLFNDVLCKRDVPIALVVTGMEIQEDTDQWWSANKEYFKQSLIMPNDHACVTAVKGKMKRGAYQFQEEYDESKQKVEDMLFRALRPTPWKMDAIVWFDKMVYQTTIESRKWRDPVERKELVQTIKGAMSELIDRCGMNRDDAEKLAKLLDAA